MVVKRYRNLGDFASPGVPILSMYNPDLIYVTANLEETRLRGVAPGNPVELQLDAFAEPFRGRVVWINKSTGAQFALMPRNVVSGEFTKVVQRVPVRIAIEKDERWPLLRAGLSVQVAIAHGAGDAAVGRAGRPGDERPGDALQPAAAPRTRGRPEGPAMTTALSPRPAVGARTCARRRRPRRMRLERRHWLAALAVLVVFFAPYQTLVQTVITDDAVRKGLEVDDYDMIWQQVGYGVGVLYGVFTGLWLSARIGARYTIALGLLGFALGNLLCGAAVGLESLVAGPVRRWLRQDDGDGTLPDHALQAV